MILTGPALRQAFADQLAGTVLSIPMPICFAGLVLSCTFKHAVNPSPAVGANLVGTMVGGFAQYLTMATGRQSLLVVMIGAYVVSLLTMLAARRSPVSARGRAA